MEYEIDIEKRKCSSVWRRNLFCPMHIQSDIEFIIVTEGALQCLIDGKNSIVPAGSVMCIESYLPHMFFDTMPYVCNVIEFSPDLLPSLREKLNNAYPAERILELPGVVMDYLLYVLPQQGEFSEDLDKIDTYNEDLIRMIGMMLGREFLMRSTFVQHEKARDKVYLEAVRIISQHFCEPISLQTVSQELGIRRETLCRKFQEAEHMSFNAYLGYVRVCHTVDLLSRGYACADAAMAAGFGSICSFNRAFKKIIGMTPTEFKQLGEPRYLVSAKKDG